MLEKVTATNGAASRRAIAIHRQLILPVAVLVVIAAGVLAALMQFNAGVLDSRAQKASIDAMREGLSERAGQLDRVVKDYAWWNEAVEAIQLRQDRAWAEARLGSYLYGTHEYDWAFVIAPDGSTFHAALEGETVGGGHHGRARQRALAAAGRAEPRRGHRRRAPGDARLRPDARGGSSASPRRRRSWPRTAGPATRPGGAPYVLVVVRSLTLEWLSELAGALNLDAAEFQPVRRPRRRPGCSWRDPMGCPSAACPGRRAGRARSIWSRWRPRWAWRCCCSRPSAGRRSGRADPRRRPSSRARTGFATSPTQARTGSSRPTPTAG